MLDGSIIQFIVIMFASTKFPIGKGRAEKRLGRCHLPFIIYMSEHGKYTGLVGMQAQAKLVVKTGAFIHGPNFRYQSSLNWSET